MKRRAFLKGAAAAAFILPQRNLFVPKAPAIIKARFPSGGAASGGGSTALDAFLATLAPDTWGQPTGTAATSVYYANDTGAPDYNSTTAGNNEGDTGGVSNWTVWGSGAHDTIKNRGIIGPTGLHEAYCGNEGYAFDFDSLTWHRMRTPSDFVAESTDTITSISWSGGVVTFTTANDHTEGTGVNVQVVGCSPSGYNGSQTLVAQVNANTFTYNLASNPGTATVLGQVTGNCIENSFWGPNDIYANGDAIPLHTYSTLLFLPNIGGDGTLWDGANSAATHAYMLDLSKGYPYQFPTTTGAPSSGWSLTSARPANALTDPSVQGWDSTSNQIWTMNKLVGGGPDVNLIYDIAGDSWRQLNNVDCSQFASGCMREGHRELWSVGTYGSGQSSSQQALNIVSTVDGSRSTPAFTPSTFSQYTNTQMGYPGFCYLQPIDKFLMVNAGNTHQLIDPVAQSASNYVTGGISLPDFSATVNSIHTRIWPYYAKHCVIMAASGDQNVYVLKTSLF